MADAYKRARDSGATQRTDWYAGVWRDVRRSLGGARPLREYQQKYKLLIAEKKEQRLLRAQQEAQVAPEICEVQSFDAPAPASPARGGGELTCEDL